MRIRHSVIFLCVAFAACGTTGTTPDGGGDPVVDSGVTYPGYAYAASNAADQNAVNRYGRRDDGKLVFLESTSTGAKGIGDLAVVAGATAPHAVDPMFSSDSLVLSTAHDRLYVVNAGSNSISVFTLKASAAPVLVGTYPTGGLFPTSLAVHGSFLYVSHAKANLTGQQVFGFSIAADGALSSIATAQYAPSAETVITHSLFSPDGSKLVVIELMTGMIDVFPVNTNGTLGTPIRNASAAPGPFGGQFSSDGVLFVTEVHPGVMNAGSVSTYSVAANGTLTVTSPSVSNAQNATCWLAATPDGKYLYASNTSSSDVSVYGIGSAGALTLVTGADVMRAPNGTTDFLGNPASGPVDSFVSADGKFFYQQYSGLGVIAAYSIGANGRLTAVTDGDGVMLPATGSEGLAGF